MRLQPTYISMSFVYFLMPSVSSCNSEGWSKKTTDPYCGAGAHQALTFLSFPSVRDLSTVYLLRHPQGFSYPASLSLAQPIIISQCFPPSFLVNRAPFPVMWK